MVFKNGGQRVYGSFGNSGYGGSDRLWYNKDSQYQKRIFKEPNPRIRKPMYGNRNNKMSQRSQNMFSYDPQGLLFYPLPPNLYESKAHYAVRAEEDMGAWESVHDSPNEYGIRGTAQTDAQWAAYKAEIDRQWGVRHRRRMDIVNLAVNNYTPQIKPPVGGYKPTGKGRGTAGGQRHAPPPQTHHAALHTAKVTGGEIARYMIISPTERGSYTQSVRELSPNMVSSLTRQGYKVTQVTRDMALAVPISISSTVKAQQYRFRRARRGISEMNIKAKTIIPSKTIILKSHYNPRSLFAEWHEPGWHEPNWNEPFHEFHRAPRLFNARRGQSSTTEQKRIYFRAGRNRYYKMKPSTAQKLITRNKWNLVLQPTLTEIPKSFPNVGSSERSNIVDQTQRQNINGEVQLMQAELRNLKAWIEKINQRTSEQLIALGESTVHRREEIQGNEVSLIQMQNWIKEMNERISKQLIDLGNATTDQSKALELAKAEKVVGTVQGGGGGILGGITGFFGSPSNIILIIIVIAMLIMIKVK